MVEYKNLDCLGIQDVLVNSEPSYVFEYEKSANELADEVNGNVVSIYYTSMVHLWNASYEDAHHIGYGVETDGEIL